MLLGLASVILSLSFLKTAWVSDDAFISFRVIEHLLKGDGLVWNVGERVQVFTHPLWLLLVGMAAFVTREEYFTSVALSAVALAVTAYGILRLSPSRVAAAIALLIAATSRFFIDYSTSGLENGLSHTIVIWLLWLHYADQPRNAAWFHRVVLAGALLAVNRLDLGVFAAPIMLHALASARRLPILAHLRAVLLGASPLLAWLLFATIYYGDPLPNTFLAKVGAGIEPGELMAQGVRYFADAWSSDAASCLLIAAGLALGVRRPHRWVAGGVALYLLYVLRVGGDFMSGRFLSVPLLACLVVLLRTSGELRMPRLAWLVVVAFLGNVPSTVLSPLSFNDHTIPPSGIEDERAFYYRHQGLLRNLGLGETTLANSPAAVQADFYRRRGNPYLICTVGLGTYLLPLDWRISDAYALTDPLLARLPAKRPWRVGHYERPAPAGYGATLRSGTNRIEDPDLAELYALIHAVNAGPILTWERAGAIVELQMASRRLVRASAFVNEPANFRKSDPLRCTPRLDDPAAAANIGEGSR